MAPLGHGKESLEIQCRRAYEYLRKYFAVIIMLRFVQYARARARIARAHARLRTRTSKVKGSEVYWSSGQEKELHEVKGSRLIFGGQES